MDNQNGEYRVKVSVRNNLILRAIEEAGYKSVAEFCRINEANCFQIHELIRLKLAPININGTFCTGANQLMEALCLAPTDLWTSEQLNMKLKSSTREFVLTQQDLLESIANGSREIMGLASPEKSAEKSELKRDIDGVLESLTPRQAEVLRLRFGLDDNEECTLEKVGQHFGVGMERIRQIEAKALRNLRHPSRADTLKPHIKLEDRN